MDIQKVTQILNDLMYDDLGWFKYSDVDGWELIEFNYDHYIRITLWESEEGKYFDDNFGLVTHCYEKLEESIKIISKCKSDSVLQMGLQYDNVSNNLS